MKRKITKYTEIDFAHLFVTNATESKIKSNSKAHNSRFRQPKWLRVSEKLIIFIFSTITLFSTTTVSPMQVASW
jgi:hypothetical protein